MEATNREKWKSVDGFANYEISSCGRVRNATTERILKPIDNGHGYLRVGMYKDSRTNHRMVHVLFANAFMKNPHNKPCVDHIDGNKQNNCIENLRFATHTENSQNSTKTSKRTSSIYKGVCFHTRIGKWIANIKIDGKLKHLGYFTTEREAGMAYNASALEHYKKFAKINVFSD